jgi:hypothetical protein
MIRHEGLSSVEQMMRDKDVGQDIRCTTQHTPTTAATAGRFLASSSAADSAYIMMSEAADWGLDERKG